MILVEYALNVILDITLITLNPPYVKNNFLDAIMLIENVCHAELHSHTIQLINLVVLMDVLLTSLEGAKAAVQDMISDTTFVNYQTAWFLTKDTALNVIQIIF